MINSNANIAVVPAVPRPPALTPHFYRSTRGYRCPRIKTPAHFDSSVFGAPKNTPGKKKCRNLLIALLIVVPASLLRLLLSQTHGTLHFLAFNLHTYGYRTLGQNRRHIFWTSYFLDVMLFVPQKHPVG